MCSPVVPEMPVTDEQARPSLGAQVAFSSPSLKRSGEGAATMAQLRQLVPSLRQMTISDELEFLQHVIDYIQDLETQLTDHEMEMIPESDGEQPRA
ncbi:DNA binding protein inhibitor ID 1 [Trichuris trichiura]|uniref:DNA binding protein inhibitor ID 1 n=1 Tax=Trichuris trichiura TaxID=36087 RepID=A0A077ZBZ8_TRITR|nr:DNA binding protein inhibitor ID 1 [Trichuris trichiura]